MAKQIRVLHLITGLNTGGAEMALYRLLRTLNRQEFESYVVCLISPGEVGKYIKDLEIQVTSLEMDPGRASLAGLWQLIHILREFKPDILQTWMYHADFLGLIAGKLAGIPAIAWNIRGSEMNFMNSQRISRLVAKACALLSGWPQVVLVNSRAGLAAHETLGYHPRKWQFVPNGIDLTEFYPNLNAGADVRAEWNIPNGSDVIGMVARLDPQKGHQYLFQAAVQVVKEKPNTHFIFVGSGPQAFADELKNQADELGLGACIHWAGNRNDMPRVYNAFSINVSPSAYGEGFPNVIAEAMASGVPCIATKTGDAADLIADAGLIVPARDSQALAWAILQILNAPQENREGLGVKARQRIESNFSLNKMAQAYTSIYKHLANFDKTQKPDHKQA